MSNAEFEEFLALRDGYRLRVANGYYYELDAFGNPRIDLHDEYDDFVAHRKQSKDMETDDHESRVYAYYSKVKAGQEIGITSPSSVPVEVEDITM
jgi:hypothetical protein